MAVSLMMDLSRRAVVLVAGAMAGCTASGACWCILAFQDPDGVVAGAAPLAPTEELRAARLLGAGPTQVAAGEAAAHRALQQGPTRAASWLDIAYADVQRHGSLTNVGRQALQRSYTFEPLGPDVTKWRVRFTLNHWDELTASGHSDVLNEIRTRWRFVPRSTWEEVFAGVTNPAGKLAARLLIDTLERPKSKT
jgi:hypothetical protein